LIRCMVTGGPLLHGKLLLVLCRNWTTQDAHIGDGLVASREVVDEAAFLTETATTSTAR
jgi:hypothetical protein